MLSHLLLLMATMYIGRRHEIDGVGRLRIPADQLPQGINLLSAFSKEGNLLAERIVFKDNKQKLKVDIQPEKPVCLPAKK